MGGIWCGREKEVGVKRREDEEKKDEEKKDEMAEGWVGEESKARNRKEEQKGGMDTWKKREQVVNQLRGKER